MEVIFVDTETIRLDPGHLVVWEIGVIDFSGDEYLWQIKPDLTIADPRALEVGRYDERIHDLLRWSQPGVAMRIYHPSLPCADGVEPEDIGRTATTLPDLAGEIYDLTKGCVIVGSKPTFDQDHLAVILAEQALTPLWEHHPLDIPSVARGWCAAKGIVSVSAKGDGKIRSDDWSRAIGVNPDAFKRHRALDDCRWVKAQYDLMLGGAS